MVKIGITIVMFLVKKIRNQKSNYLEVPDEVLSWRMVGQIMSLGHVLPSLALQGLVVADLYNKPRQVTGVCLWKILGMGENY